LLRLILPALLFSALIHDLDHPGVPNATLVSEKTTLASNYNNQSVAEQFSIDLGWGLWMRDEYKELRAAVCGDQDGLSRFRQLVVNVSVHGYP
jgi:3'5'-cyclic nucleotide phosphodiesterase